ncbi:glycosyltransferase family 5 protein [Backusella circina FSU 941]|nr:glycosyltransferase family 5 protein [Backusella circina FSU 941]
MGGMGTVLTSLAQAQLRTGLIQPYIVMPYYGFLRQKDKFPVKRHTDLVTTIRDAKGKTKTVDFKVFRMVHYFNPDDNESKQPEKISVFLIGPGRTSPFNRAFQANTISQIYSSPDGLPQEWMYQYFDKAAAAFLIWKATGKHEQSLFAPMHDQTRVDVVHLHGATNAYVAKYIKEVEKASLLGPHPPAIIYTMHDYLDELQYTNTVENVDKFLSTGETMEVMAPYTYGNKVFMAPFGIDSADSVTFVSQSMAKDMIEGRLEFYLKELVMKSLLNKAQAHTFYGISNGIDFSSSVNPFTDRNLAELQLVYPNYAKDVIELKMEQHNTDWTLPQQRADFVIEAKLKAKKYLIETGWLNERDADKPLVLFVGRFQYNKGLETFDTAVQLFKQNGMKFAIVGQPNNYPFNWVKRLKDRNPDDVVLIYEDQQQDEWLSTFRAAADFVYVPSITESFGLVAAEGLLFGSSVISTGAGGLREFLVDGVDSNNNQYNSYLFDDLTTLSTAISQASTDYNTMRRDDLVHEAYVLRMMQSAFALGWSRQGGEHKGPIYDYLRVYQKSMRYKRATSLFDMD